MTDVQLGILVASITAAVSSVMGIITIVVNKRLAIAERKAGTYLIVEQAKAEAEALRISTLAKEEALKIHLDAAAERLRKEALRVAAELREDQRIDMASLHASIAEVKEVATHAFHEANGVKMLLSQDKKDAKEETGKKLDSIQITANEIKERVDDL